MNLLLLTSSFPSHPDDGRAAAGLFVADLAGLLAADGHRVVVATPDKAGEKSRWPAFTVHWLPWPGGDKPLAQVSFANPREWPGIATLFWRAPRQLVQLCQAHSIEGVIALWAVPAGWWARHLKRTLGLPFVTWCLGSDIWTFGRTPGLRMVVRLALQDSDAIYADGLHLAEETQHLCSRPCSFLPSSRLLDPHLATPVAAAARRPLFFFLGRYASVKGVDVLLEAMAIYVRRGGTGALIMRGGGPLDQSVRERAGRTDLRGRVDVGGFADRAAAASYLAACDVLVIPSRQESIPVVFSDGLQMGRPLIVSDVGDMGDLMRRYQAGLVVHPNDSQGLAQAMLSIDRSGTETYREAVDTAARDFDLRESAAVLVLGLHLHSTPGAAAGRQ